MYRWVAAPKKRNVNINIYRCSSSRLLYNADELYILEYYLKSNKLFSLPSSFFRFLLPPHLLCDADDDFDHLGSVPCGLSREDFAREEEAQLGLLCEKAARKQRESSEKAARKKTKNVCGSPKSVKEGVRCQCENNHIAVVK